MIVNNAKHIIWLAANYLGTKEGSEIPQNEVVTRSGRIYSCFPDFPFHHLLAIIHRVQLQHLSLDLGLLASAEDLP